MAPTEGRVTKPERRWDCCRGKPCTRTRINANVASLSVYCWWCSYHDNKTSRHSRALSARHNVYVSWRNMYQCGTGV